MRYKTKKPTEVKIKKDKTLEEIYDSAQKKALSVEQAGEFIDSLLKTSTEAATILPEVKSDVGESVNSSSNPTLPAIDKVGSIGGKEKAASEVGLTRVKYLRAIVELLEAKVKKVVGVNEFGADIVEEVADLDKRAKGAELAGKFFNDYKEQVVSTGNTYNKIVYQWLSAPSATVVGNRV